MNEENGSEQWFSEFEKFTGIHLNHQFIPNNEYYDKLKLAFASDEVPEVFDLNGANLALYASQGAIYDLTDLLKASELYDKVDPAIWEAITIDGKIYAIPKEIPSAAVTYVRGDWLERLGMKAPTNYEEFLEMIRRFKAEIPECEIGLTAPGIKSEMNLPEFYQGAHYGFAKVDKKEKMRWGAMMDDYFQQSTYLRHVLHLVDIRHEPTQDDIAMNQYFRQMGIPFTVIATKADKISRGARMKQIAPICRALLVQPWEILCYSSEDGQGRSELLGMLGGLLQKPEEPETEELEEETELDETEE